MKEKGKKDMETEEENEKKEVCIPRGWEWKTRGEKKKMCGLTFMPHRFPRLVIQRR